MITESFLNAMQSARRVARSLAPTSADLSHLGRMSDMAIFLMDKHGLRPGEPDGWNFEWSATMTSTAGLCDSEKRKLRFSIQLFALWTDDQCEETILHEIAHALVPASWGRHHTPEWRAMAIKIGCSGKRCWGSNGEARITSPRRSPSRPSGRWMGTCPCCRKKFRVGSGRKTRYSCPKCSPDGFDELFELEDRKFEPY